MTPLAAPSDVRLLALDVDGTIVDHGDQPSLAVVDGIRALLNAGIHVVLATGRELHNVTALCSAIGADELWTVCSNGAVTARVTPDGWEVTEQVPFDPRPALVALADLAPDLRFAIEEVGVGFVMNGPFDESEIRGPRRLLAGPVPSTATLVITRSEEHRSREMMGAISELDVYGMPYDEGTTGFVDLSSAEVSKLTGVQAVASAWGVPDSACAAVGDFLNDIPLLEWAGWGVAMGHSPGEVIDAADAVAPGIADDGLVAVIQALLARLEA